MRKRPDRETFAMLAAYHTNNEIAGIFRVCASTVVKWSQFHEVKVKRDPLHGGNRKAPRPVAPPPVVEEVEDFGPWVWIATPGRLCYWAQQLGGDE